MNDEEMRVVRENIERNDERQRERRQTLRHDFEHLADFLDAIEMAKRVAVMGIVPSVAWILQAGIAIGGPGAVVGVVLGWICCSIVAYFAPFAGALLAHHWFRNSGYSSARIAAALALLMEAAFFGWIVVLTHS